jgi:hypothetical protein
MFKLLPDDPQALDFKQSSAGMPCGSSLGRGGRHGLSVLQAVNQDTFGEE